MVIALVLLVGFGFFIGSEFSTSETTTAATTSVCASSAPTQSGYCVECQVTFYNVGGGMGTVTLSHITNYTTTTNASQTSGYSTTTTVYPSTTITGGYYWNVKACTYEKP